MTYDQAIQNGYKEQVDAVNAVSCDYSARTEWPGKHPGEIEFTASYKWTAEDGYEYTIVARYYQDADAIAASDGELDRLDWVAFDYEIDL